MPRKKKTEQVSEEPKVGGAGYRQFEPIKMNNTFTTWRWDWNTPKATARIESGGLLVEVTSKKATFTAEEFTAINNIVDDLSGLAEEVKS
jgi:hypothetical protein